MLERNYAGLRDVCLIGSGDLMVNTAEVLTRKGFTVRALLAPRHANEELPLTGGIVHARLKDAGVFVHIVDDINDLSTWPVERMAGRATLSLCFGPAWIFSDAVIAAFGFGMINVNLIPVPRYLGGAHYTWQILNGDRSGGCFLQTVSSVVDRGDILLSHEFQVPPSARVPQDYFQANFEHGRHCLDIFIRAVVEGTPLKSHSFESLNPDRIYLPRVLTMEQAYIDWRWSAGEIVRFCNAFDRPYPGAGTFLDGALVRVKDVQLLIEFGDFHPFAAGLVVRRVGLDIVVAASGGALRLGIVEDDAGNDFRHHLREGRRLVTPVAYLEHALALHPRLSAKGFRVPSIGAEQ